MTIFFRQGKNGMEIKCEHMQFLITIWYSKMGSENFSMHLKFSSGFRKKCQEMMCSDAKKALGLRMKYKILI